MQIVWHGGSTIELSEKKSKVILNPPAKMDLKGYQVVAYDVTDEKHPTSEGVLMVDWPGEYDTAGFAFRGVESQQGKKAMMAYSFQSKDGNVAWMGEMSEYPSEEFIETLGEVHVLILPVGDKGVLKAKDAYRLVEALEPLIVIPICFGGDHDGLSGFLKEMDVKMPEVKKSFEFKKSALGGEEAMELVVLEGA